MQGAGGDWPRPVRAAWFRVFRLTASSGWTSTMKAWTLLAGGQERHGRDTPLLEDRLGLHLDVKTNGRVQKSAHRAVRSQRVTRVPLEVPCWTKYHCREEGTFGSTMGPYNDPYITLITWK